MAAMMATDRWAGSTRVSERSSYAGPGHRESAVHMIDTHCHLDSPPLSDDVAGVLARAAEAGVCDVVAQGYDAASWEAVARIAAGYGGVHAALGLHPWVADQPLDPVDLAGRLAAVGAVAVGEIGLDTKIEGPGLEVQIAVLERQLDLARELDLPVVLHCRGAFEELASLLAGRMPPVRGVLHAFSRGPELAKRFVGLGLFLGIGGAVTRPQGKRLHRAVAVVGLDRLVLETDAPSIGLHGVAAAATEPHHVRDIAAGLAEVLQVDVAAVAERTTANARDLFRI